MNEMELKYGCNPNQKPARVFMHNDKDLPFTGLKRKTRLYQPAGRLQWLAAGKRTERSYGTSGSSLL